MPLKAILFGSIGTVVETSDLQRQAFNTVFEEAGLDWRWDTDAYREMLKRSGGKKRIADFAEHSGIEVDVDKLHRRKTHIFNERMRDDGLKLRPDVGEVIDWAKGKDMKLGFVTSTERQNVDAIISATDELSGETFDFVGERTMVENDKPAPDIYLKALQKLEIDKQDAIAIEDTVACYKSPVQAGIATIVFPNAYADKEGYDGALTVVDRLTVDLFVGR